MKTTSTRSRSAAPTHAYGVGLAKTGTSSLARAFALSGSSHEQLHYRLEPLGFARIRREIDDATFWRLAGDRLTQPSVALDVCSSHHFYADVLAQNFSTSTFVWTVRGVQSWSNSVLDMEIREAILADACGAAEVCRRMRFPRRPYVQDEVFAREVDTAMLPGLIRMWSEHMLRMESLLPPHRVMQVRVNDLNARLSQICSFIGADSKHLINISTPANAKPAGLTFDRWSHSSVWHEAYLTHAARHMEHIFPEEHEHVMALITQPVRESRAERAWTDYIARARAALAFPSRLEKVRYRAMLQQAARAKNEVDAAIADSSLKQLA